MGVRGVLKCLSKWLIHNHLPEERIGGLYHRNPGRPAFAAGFLLLLVDPLASAPAQTQRVPEEKGFLKRHYKHWITAFGMRFVDAEYNDLVGYSTDPLLFSDPPGFDVTVRDWIAEEEPGKNWFQTNFGRFYLATSITTVILANRGSEGTWRRIADDTSGLIEVWYFNKGATGLVKNIVGRHRPQFEFIDEEDLTPEEREEEEESVSNRQSFFSGSTSQYFSTMSYLDAIVARRVESRGARVASFIGFYGFAAYVGYTRMELDRHYLTDVVAGAAAGTLIGRAFDRVHHGPVRSPEIEEAKRFEIRSLSVGGGGLSFMVSVRP